MRKAVRTEVASVYLRNLHSQPILIPLGGVARYLPPAATTGPLPPGVRQQPGVAQAVDAGLVIGIMLPPASGPWRLQGVPLRAPVSAAARHLLACQVGMEQMVAARSQMERRIAAARETARRVSWFTSRRERQEWRLTKGLNRAIVFYRALRAAAVEAGLPQRHLLALLDGNLALPEFLAGHLIEPGSGEANGVGGSAVIRRYQRRAFSAARLVRVAMAAIGAKDDPGVAARWLADALVDKYSLSRAAAD
jgi:hypothetical protein